MVRQLKLSDEQLEELQRTGEPLVVSMGDGPRLVVQSAEAYRRMIEFLDELDLAQSGRICSERWQAIQNGTDAGVSPEDFFAEIHRRLRPAG